MKTLFKVQCSFLLVCTMLLGCERSPDADFKPTLTITFPEQGSAPTLPFAPGGRFVVKVVVDVGRLCNTINAQVELLEAQPPAGQKTSELVKLKPMKGPCEMHEGSVTLAWPRGGPVHVRASIAGAVDDVLVPLDAPVLSAQASMSSRKGEQLLVPVCIESSATSGSVDVRLTDATFVGGGNTTTLTLEPGECTSPPLLQSARHSRARFDVYTKAETFELIATLVGTELAPFRQSVSVNQQVGAPGLTVTASQSSLPEADEVIEVVALVTLNGLPANGIPVRFETVPETEFLPTQTVSNSAGEARTQVFVSDEIEALRVDAIAGGLRQGVTLRRAP